MVYPTDSLRLDDDLSSTSTNYQLDANFMRSWEETRALQSQPGDEDVTRQRPHSPLPSTCERHALASLSPLHPNLRSHLCQSQ